MRNRNSQNYINTDVVLEKSELQATAVMGNITHFFCLRETIDDKRREPGPGKRHFPLLFLAKHCTSSQVRGLGLIRELFSSQMSSSLNP